MRVVSIRMIVAFSFLALYFAIFAPHAYSAPNLSTEIYMNIKANSAASAKKEAQESAMRSAAIQILSRYADRAAVENQIAGASEQALLNLIASMGISNEKSSKTAYEARFAITLDRIAAEKWYEDNDIASFIGAADESRERLAVSIEMPNGISDWTNLNQILMTDDKCGLTIETISAGNAAGSIWASKRRKFQNLISLNGWSVSSRDGILKIAKMH